MKVCTQVKAKIFIRGIAFEFCRQIEHHNKTEHSPSFNRFVTIACVSHIRLTTHSKLTFKVI